ncbi:hypothetical protein M231_05192 [Tremella mesenterica]|uniref:Uncharacterized protein n=1 Tax=Tremella mesenterica TaxID=5217 RepID=A0A4V1M3P3_TREME|nr:hypothetical protein M231_05192 [Tremella mesenterica]
MLFIVLRTRKAEAAQKALEVSLGVTRFRHREGLEALHQYVKEEEPIPMPKPPARPQSPPRINLNDIPPPQPSKPKDSKSPGGKEWKPPQNIAIYLSTIELPDLIPGHRTTDKPKSPPLPQKEASKLNSGKQTKPSPVPPRDHKVEGKKNEAGKKEDRKSGLGKLLGL